MYRVAIFAETELLGEAAAGGELPEELKLITRKKSTSATIHVL